MDGMRRILNSKPLFWALLAIPALVILPRWFGEDVYLPDDLIAPTGVWAARFIILALMLTPLSMLSRGASWIRWLVQRRRALGVAAFAYSVLHLFFYLLDMETLENVLAEIGAFGIWTGWAAILLMLPLALTSNDAAMRALKTGWKRLQRLVYPTALLTLIHWMFIHDSLAEALIHFAPLAALQLYRLLRRFEFRSQAPHQEETA